MAPPSLTALPIELLVFVIEDLDRVEDVAALARASRRLYSTANPYLYKRAAQCRDARPLAWAANRGLVSTLRMALAAGADPNHEFIEHLPAVEWERASAAAAAAVLADRPKEPWAMWDYDSRGGSDLKGPSRSPEPPESSQSAAHGDDADGAADTGTPASSADQSSSHPASVSDRESVVSSLDEDQSRRSEATPATEPSTPSPSGSATVTRRYSAIHLAARGGHNEIIKILFDYGASLDVSSTRFCACMPLRGLLNDLEDPEEDAEPPRWSPLHVAICHSHGDTAKLLLSRKASRMMVSHVRCDDNPEPERSSGAGLTALHHAAAMGLVDVVRYIMDHKLEADVDVRDDHTLTPFYHAYAHRRWDSTVPQLLALGADINATIKMYIPYSAITALGEACRLGHFDAADRLVDLGADARKGFLATTKGGCLTPLHMCCMRSAQPAGAGGAGENDDVVDEDEARGRARMRTIERLLAAGAEIDARDCFGSTPLMAAVQARNTFALEALSLAGAEPGPDELDAAAARAAAKKH
ncbi:uncharacterized protein THITE_118267 [Thermothielavioides terrestris NRRL 8126]|uniref:Uncharacterized protein n=1 Tax=Thermothielavioides terrestris (strain ATCC 38088 / NRRL 8126) TaxID=578455 RepID=G2R0B5_THETT|nr:uncharacterized protein THITE_118267 [Thermothielavioides terrestris NRRL 8126]AEO67283.1 hypothetical protein THITE_118267 [Thermothielavioides terrestris NRRL 8126]